MRPESCASGPKAREPCPGPSATGAAASCPRSLTRTPFSEGSIPAGSPAWSVGAAFGETERAIDNHIGGPLGLNIEDAAAAILAVASNQLASAIRLVSVEKGHDPRDFALFPFGGAGALHAVELARELGIPKVLVPRFPGITSALGCVIADLRHDFVHTMYRPLQEVDAGNANNVLAEQARVGHGDDRG